MLSTTSQTVSPFSREALHDYQERAVTFIKDTPSCALWVDMGLGKTITVLTALADLLGLFEIGRVLIVAPLRVAQTTWPAEIERWEHTRGLSFRVVQGNPEARLRTLLSDKSDIHIINREQVPWLVQSFETEPALRRGGWPYDTVVLDEASSFKSSRTKRFKALRRALPYIDRLIELTGTPASNGLLDVWSQIFLLDRGERLGRTYSAFRARHFISDYMGYNWTLRDGADQEIYEKLRDICLTLSADEYLQLPERIDNVIELQLPDRAREHYLSLERDFLLQLEDKTIAVAHAAALSNKLLQFANGGIYTDEEKNWTAVHDAKLDALENLVAESAGAPLLVAYNYQIDVERILGRVPQAERLDSRVDTIERWNRGEIPVLLAHPASAGHGLNLQHGGNTVVWFGLNWSLELYQQFNARLHRQGQERPVIIHHLVAQDTVDETVLSVLHDKYVTQRALLEALKSDVRSRRV